MGGRKITSCMGRLTVNVVPQNRHDYGASLLALAASPLAASP
jgi:hypothetical protein